jgi:hypothetical protein
MKQYNNTNDDTAVELYISAVEVDFLWVLFGLPTHVTDRPVHKNARTCRKLVAVRIAVGFA